LDWSRKKHKCPECKEEFEDFESVREKLKGDGKGERIFCIDACPLCGHVYSEGCLTPVSNSWISRITRKFMFIFKAS
jgi:rubredoxin